MKMKKIVPVLMGVLLFGSMTSCSPEKSLTKQEFLNAYNKAISNRAIKVLYTTCKGSLIKNSGDKISYSKEKLDVEYDDVNKVIFGFIETGSKLVLGYTDISSLDTFVTEIENTYVKQNKGEISYVESGLSLILYVKVNDSNTFVNTYYTFDSTGYITSYLTYNKSNNYSSKTELYFSNYRA